MVSKKYDTNGVNVINNIILNNYNNNVHIITIHTVIKDRANDIMFVPVFSTIDL